MQDGIYPDEKHLAVIGCGNKVQDVAEGLVSVVEVVLGCENMMRADFKMRVSSSSLK